MIRYSASLTKDGSSILVTFRDVPEAITFGKNEKEALVNAVDALMTGLSFYITARKALPKPCNVKRGQKIISLSPLQSAKLRACQTMIGNPSKKIKF